jgi:hypothetical protein
MHEPAPFQVTSEARVCIRRILRPPLGMEPALILVFGFDERDGRGGSKAKFEGEHFMIGFNSFGQREQWPRFDLCGSNILISPEALERLRGKTLALRAYNVSTGAARKEIRELLVVA